LLGSRELSIQANHLTPKADIISKNQCLPFGPETGVANVRESRRNHKKAPLVAADKPSSPKPSVSNVQTSRKTYSKAPLVAAGTRHSRTSRRKRLLSEKQKQPTFLFSPIS